MQKDGKYGGQPELLVLSRMYSVKIVVHAEDGVKTIYPEHSVNTPQCAWHLLYRSRPQHFQCLVVRRMGRSCVSFSLFIAVKLP